jgi:hypothetical protein
MSFLVATSQSGDSSLPWTPQGGGSKSSATKRRQHDAVAVIAEKLQHCGSLLVAHGFLPIVSSLLPSAPGYPDFRTWQSTVLNVLLRTEYEIAKERRNIIRREPIRAHTRAHTHTHTDRENVCVSANWKFKSAAIFTERSKE